MTTLTSLSASELRRAAEIKDQIEALQKQLNACLGGYVGNGFAAARSAAPGGRAAKVRAGKGGKTVASCILEALGNDTMPVQKILIRANQIRGKRISPAMLGFTLAQMKKTKQIDNPARGQYRKR